MVDQFSAEERARRVEVAVSLMRQQARCYRPECHTLQPVGLPGLPVESELCVLSKRNASPRP